MGLALPGPPLDPPLLIHNQERETPLPIYLGVMIHTKTQKRELVGILHELGLSILYDRVLGISTEAGNKICSHYERERVVCPPELKNGLFTTAAVDNIDYKRKNLLGKNERI